MLVINICCTLCSVISEIMVSTEILRIIEGGLASDKRKIVSYSNRLADRLDQEGECAMAKAIRKKLENNTSGVVADAVRTAPLDSDSRLQMVEVFPPNSLSHTLVLDPFVKTQIDEFIKIVENSQRLELNGLNVAKTLLLYGRPGCGKTTMLRDIVRNYSYGLRCSPLKVTIIDERGEIAACVDGIPQNDIGPRTDVCNMGNKKEGVFAALRSMSPDLIVMDEIGGDDDVEAVKKAVYLGVRVIATVHGYSLKDCYLRSDLTQIINNNGFNKIIVLSNKNGAGTVADMIDLEEKSDCVY